MIAYSDSVPVYNTEFATADENSQTTVALTVDTPRSLYDVNQAVSIPNDPNFSQYVPNFSQYVPNFSQYVPNFSQYVPISLNMYPISLRTIPKNQGSNKEVFYEQS